MLYLPEQRVHGYRRCELDSLVVDLVVCGVVCCCCCCKEAKVEFVFVGKVVIEVKADNS